MASHIKIALREHVAFVEECCGHRDAARHFRVSPRFVNDLVILKRETGSLSRAGREILAVASFRRITAGSTAGWHRMAN